MRSTSKALAVVLLVLGLCAPAHAAIARVDTGSNSASGFANTSLNITDVTVSGSDRVLIAALTCDSTTDHDASATWNGVAGTRIVNSATNRYVAVFIWSAESGNEPATGTNTLAFSWTTGSLPIAIAAAYTGVDAADGYDAAAEATGTSGSLTVNATTQTNDLVAVFVTENNTTALTSPTNVTQVLSVPESSQAVLVLGESTGNGTVSPTWTGSGFDSWRIAAVNLNVGAGGGGGSKSKGLTFGVGF